MKKTEPQNKLLQFEGEAFCLKSASGRWKVFLSMTQGPLAHGETESKAWENALMKYYINYPQLKPNPKP